MKSSLLTAAGMLAAGGLLLTACAADPTLDETWPEVRRQAVDAQSLRLQIEGADREVASSSSGGTEVQSGRADLAGATDDSHLAGTVYADMGGTTVDLEVLRLQDEMFLKVDAEGEETPEGMETLNALVGDRWMLMPASEAEDMAGDMSLSSMMDELEEDMPAEDAFDGKDLKAETVELDGADYQKYTLPEEYKDFARVMYVDPKTKTLHRLEGVRPEGDVGDSVATFTDWNTVEAPARPADEDVVDMAALSALAG